jgi:hypothetical protein
VRLNNVIFEYVAVYVNELLIAAQDPSSITKALCNHHQFKLKDTGALQYHFGFDYFEDNTDWSQEVHRKDDQAVQTHDWTEANNFLREGCSSRD